jgi:hypothetical protein
MLQFNVLLQVIFLVEIVAIHFSSNSQVLQEFASEILLVTERKAVVKKSSPIDKPLH